MSSSSNDSPPGSRARQREQTRQRILDVAVKQFAEYGFEGASLGAIATAAGVQKALIQYHFETKDNLWREAVTSLWQARDASLNMHQDAVHAELDRGSIRQAFREIMKFTQAHREWFAIMFREAARPSPRLDWLLEHHVEKDYRDSLAFVEAAQQRGLLPQVAPLPLLHIISGALSYLLFVKPLCERVMDTGLSDDAFLDQHVDTLMALLAARD